MKGWAPPRVDVNDLPALPEGMARERKEKQRELKQNWINRYNTILRARID
jgi:hypothetical protein